MRPLTSAGSIRPCFFQLRCLLAILGVPGLVDASLQSLPLLLPGCPLLVHPGGLHVVFSAHVSLLFSQGHQWLD